MAFTKLVPLDRWRCKKCGKNAGEGATPRYERGNTLPMGTCLDCQRERNRRAGARNAIRERIKIGRKGEADPTFRFPKSELARRYRANAANCEGRAQEAANRGDDYTAYRLRDQAKDWLALAAKPYAQ